MDDSNIVYTREIGTDEEVSRMDVTGMRGTSAYERFIAGSSFKVDFDRYYIDLPENREEGT